MAKVPDLKDNEDRCVCRTCPSYPFEGLIFCSHGRSERIVNQIGCLCPECDNFADYGLRDGYYCQDGRAGEEAQ